MYCGLLINVAVTIKNRVNITDVSNVIIFQLLFILTIELLYVYIIKKEKRKNTDTETNKSKITFLIFKSIAIYYLIENIFLLTLFNKNTPVVSLALASVP